jgi:hypothetical protein
MKKTETIQEFLARGGKITRVPAIELTYKTESIKSTTAGGPAVFLSLAEADLMYGEQKIKKAKKVSVSIDISVLPEELRKKYVDGVLNGDKEENEEDDGDDE